MRRTLYGSLLRHALLPLLLWLLPVCLSAQSEVLLYTFKKGQMYIELGKKTDPVKLIQFVQKYNLTELPLLPLLQNGKKDSLEKLGWTVNSSNPEKYILSKRLTAYEDFDHPTERMVINLYDATLANNPSLSQTNASGRNNFKKQSSLRIRDSVVTFVFKDQNAREVKLAASFTNWQKNALRMTKTDSGWTAVVKLSPGKYYYKFLADGKWLVDENNRNTETDGRGYTNSVLYMPNHVFRLSGYPKARKVYVAGTFNNWQKEDWAMQQLAGEWILPVYLSDGTHTYRFVADGNWMPDPANKDVFPNELGDVNSVVRVGPSHLFTVKGFEKAQSVKLIGSFNRWQSHELLMQRTRDGWEIPYTLGPGNYEYKFLIDDEQYNAEGKKVEEFEPGSTFIIQPNYTFRLKGFGNAGKVLIAGDFNGWSPNAFSMKKEGEEWTISLHLPPGKHLYKFIVDDKWILDPGNDLWEENEFGTGNSVLWMEPFTSIQQ